MITSSIKSIEPELLYDRTKITIVLDNKERMKALKWLDSVSIVEGKEYEIDVKRHYNKRTINANSYLRVLERKIADVMGQSLDEVHNDMLCKYGQLEQDENGDLMYVVLKTSVDWREKEYIHLNPTGKFMERNGERYQWFEVMRPSHTYNSKEMAILIDGVVDEAKALNIETKSPDEIRHMEGLAE